MTLATRRLWRRAEHQQRCSQHVIGFRCPESRTTAQLCLSAGSVAHTSPTLLGGDFKSAVGGPVALLIKRHYASTFGEDVPRQEKCARIDCITGLIRGLTTLSWRDWLSPRRATMSRGSPCCATNTRLSERCPQDRTGYLDGVQRRLSQMPSTVLHIVWLAQAKT